MLMILLTVVINMMMLLFSQVHHVIFCLTLTSTCLEALDLDNVNNSPVIVKTVKLNVKVSEAALSVEIMCYRKFKTKLECGSFHSEFEAHLANASSLLVLGNDLNGS